MRSCEQPAAGICPGEQGSTRASSIQLLIDLSFSRLAPGIAALRLEAAGLCALTRPLSVGHELSVICVLHSRHFISSKFARILWPELKSGEANSKVQT